MHDGTNRQLKTPAINLTDSQSHISCVAWNINGLGAKMSIDNFQDYLKMFDIILLSETWLQEKDTDMVTFGSYKIHHVIRKKLHNNARRGSGGLTIMSKCGIEVEVVEEK